MGCWSRLLAVSGAIRTRQSHAGGVSRQLARSLGCQHATKRFCDTGELAQCSDGADQSPEPEPGEPVDDEDDVGEPAGELAAPDALGLQTQPLSTST